MKKILLTIITLVIALSGCSSKNDVAMKVGDVEVKQDYIDYFSNNFNTQSGGTVSDSIKQQAYQQAEIYAQLIAIGKNMNLDVQDTYDKYVNDIIKTHGDIDSFKKSQNISDELFDFIIYGDSYRMALLEECKKENGITPEMEDEYFKANFWRAKHLLIKTEENNETKNAEVKALIDELYNQVKNGADFDALIAQYNEDPGVEGNPDGYIFTDGEMVSEFQDGVSSIEIGEYNLIETSYGYHIVQRLALDETPELYEDFKESKIISIDQVILGDLYFKENYWRAKHLLLLTQNMTDNEKEEVKEQIDELYEEVLEGADFDELIDEYNEDPGVAANPDGYVFTDGDMVKEFQDGVSSIQIGEFNLVETSYGYHIVQRLALDETPELYQKFKSSQLASISAAADSDINTLFSDYINAKLDEYSLETLKYTK